MKAENQTSTGNEGTNDQTLYKLGGAAALLAVLTGLTEIMITFLPGGNVSSETVIDWFTLFQDNRFMGLRNLGLINIVLTALSVPFFLALYAAHRKTDQWPATLATILSFIGVAVFYATNRAFPMLELSNQYAAATTETQRALLAATGQAMLSVGKSHAPGTFLGFFISEIASILISIVMLRNKIFGKAAAYAGIVGFTCFLIFEVCSSFAPRFEGAMIFAMSGGILTMAWYILSARKLFQLGRE